MAEAAEPTLLHAHFGWAALYALPLAQNARRAAPMRWRSDVTVFPQRPSSPDQVAADLPSAVHHLAQALAVSAFIAREVRVLGWRGPAEVIPAGVSLERFPHRSEPPRKNLARVLFVGRLVHARGWMFCFVRLRPWRQEQRANLTLDVIGDGEPRAALSARLTRRLGLDGCMRCFFGSGARVRSPRQWREPPHRRDPKSCAHHRRGGRVAGRAQGGARRWPSRWWRHARAETEEVMPPEFRAELVPPDDAEALAARLEARS